MKRTLLTITSLLTIMANNAIASNASNKDTDKDYQLFDTEIFSLSKRKENAFDVASSTYVLSSEDIRRSGATSIPEALRMVPGLQVARIDGHKWAISARGFNEQFSNKLLVMIDGRTVYTPLFSGVVWDVQDYVLEDVEKIEVIRGSGGAIWGANAVNGIINIITKNAVDTQGGYASAITGNQDRAIAEVRYGGRTESLNHYRLYAKQVNRNEMDRRDSNQNNNDGYRQSQAGFRYDIRSIADSSIVVHGDARNGKADNYFDFSSITSTSVVPPKKADKYSKGGNLVVSWDKTLSKKSSFTLQSYLDYDQFDTGILSRDGRTVDVDFQHFYDFSRENQLAWGLGYRLIRDKINETALKSPALVALDYTPNKKNDEIWSAFLQDKIGLIADKLYLTVGSKFEKNDFTGFEFQPSAKLTLLPARNQTAWASISRAVRTPTRGEKGLDVNLTNQKSNRLFNSENVIAYELGYRIKPSRTSLIDVATFYNDYSRLLTFNGTPATVSNLGEGKSYGTEVTAKWQAMAGWRLEVGYDFLKLDLKNNNVANEKVDAAISQAEGQSPNNQFRLRSNYNITPKIEFDNMFYYVDALPSSGVADSSSGIVNKGVPAYTRFDTRIGYLFNSNLDLSLGVQNITDHRHPEFNGGLAARQTEVGRTVYVKTTVKLW